ncbi:uncharacterized protein LOC103982918 [Musa acuminata AAA Group]|uniref:uncharacterized protein LOC103982918 n=1 Tax=Musa acuminata AAA Group TaxID=214697 RepID=UPI0031CF4282
MGSLSHERKSDTGASFPSSISSSPSPSPSPSLCSSNSSGAKYIEHNVSKLDTLAGIAIKYGVEVADIKRINGLVMDLQMFAHKSLLIPLPGRHPSSPPIRSNGFVDNRDRTPICHPQRDVLDSPQPLKSKSQQHREISSAMCSLRRYYDLPQHERSPTAEGTEMTLYKTGGALNSKDEPLPKVSPASNSQPRRSRGFINSFLSEEGDLMQELLVSRSGDSSDGENSKTDKPVRRRQRADVDPFGISEAVVKDESQSLLGRMVRGLTPKQLLVSYNDTESARQSTSSLEESLVANGFLAVRKSSSTPSLQESENDSVWTSSSKWTSKPDIVTRPIFYGLSKQISVWRSKAALD